MKVVIPKPLQFVWMQDGEVLHLELKQGLALSFYLQGSGGGVFFNDLKPSEVKNKLQAVIKDLSLNLSHRDLSQLACKLIGAAELVDIAKLFLEDYNIHVVSFFRSSQSMIEAFFYTDSGRLRVYEGLGKNADTSSLQKAKAERKKRVLIVDDSRTIRQLLSDILSKDPELEVAGVAEHPKQVEQLIKDLRPDVMTLDINMPDIDGVTLVEKLLPLYPMPIVMITALSMEAGNQVLRALELGAVDYIQKPSFDQMQEAAYFIREKIKIAAKSVVHVARREEAKNRKILSLRTPLKTCNSPVIAIGASTGGTEAIKTILQMFPDEIPPVVIVQHIPPVFSAAFAKRLNELCTFDVIEAKNGDEVRNNRVLVAPGGQQMSVVKVQGGIKVQIKEGDLVNGHKPSVDVLFDSVASLCGANSIGVLLTGMGNDGAKGMLNMRQKGAKTVAQDEASCVVFGMPAVAVKLGAAEKVKPLELIAAQIFDWVSQFKS